MLTALATAALIPSSRLLAAPGANCHEKNLAATLTALERASWEAYQAYDVKKWDSIYADTFFELLADASFWTKEEVMADIRSRAWETHWFEMSEIRVEPMNETSALICYKIDAEFTWHTTDEETGEPVAIPYITNAYATCAYAKIRGRWKGCIYQETGVPV
jgi:hypothetical protein